MARPGIEPGSQAQELKTLTTKPRHEYTNILNYIKQVKYRVKTVSAFELELYSSLESGFPGALHLQSTVGLVLQYLSH